MTDAIDAARYRFLRHLDNAIVYAKSICPGWGQDGKAHIRYDTPEQLDEAIDIAIEAGLSDGFKHQEDCAKLHIGGACTCNPTPQKHVAIDYPCGCSANGTFPLPNYCPDHGSPPSGEVKHG
jgi:hypothetical protein